MKVHITFLDTHLPDLHLDMDVVPRKGDSLFLASAPYAAPVVRTVEWYLTHDEDGNELDEPFVYVAVGPASLRSRMSRTT